MLSRSYGRVLYMANQLTQHDVNRIAELAHLQLSDEEAALFTRQLGDILRYAERLQEVDTTTVVGGAAVVAPRRKDEEPCGDRTVRVSPGARGARCASSASKKRAP